MKVRSGAFVVTDGETEPHRSANDESKQEELLQICEKISGVSVPG